jgi:hypothetical protein
LFAVSATRQEGYYDDLLFFAPLKILFGIEAAVPFIMAILNKGFGCFQQAVNTPTFLSTPYHIGRELSDGSQCQILCVEYVCLFIPKPYEQIQVVAVTADSLWCILSDFDIQ